MYFTFPVNAGNVSATNLKWQVLCVAEAIIDLMSSPGYVCLLRIEDTIICVYYYYC